MSLQDAALRTPRRRLITIVSVPIAIATADDPLKGVRSLVAPFLEVLPHEELVAFAPIIVELFPDSGAVLDGAPTLQDVARSTEERRFWLFSKSAALVHRAIEVGWPTDRRFRISLGDLAACDRLALQAIYQLRLRQNPRVEVTARIDRDLFASIKRGPRSPEGLWDSEATFHRFLADFLAVDDRALSPFVLELMLPALRRRGSRSRSRTQPRGSVAPIEMIETLVRWGQYDIALDELGAALDGPAEGADRFALYQATALVHAELGGREDARRAHEIAYELAPRPADRARVLGSLGRFDDGIAVLDGHDDPAANIARTRLALLAGRDDFLAGEDLPLDLQISAVGRKSQALEEEERYAEALATWRELAHVPASLYGRFYFYREAGLVSKLGETEAAEHLYRRAFDEARHVHDDFHAIYIAYGLGELAEARGDRESASRWFQESHACALRCAEHSRAALARTGVERVAQPRSPASAPKLPTKLERPFHLLRFIRRGA